MGCCAAFLAAKLVKDPLDPCPNKAAPVATGPANRRTGAAAGTKALSPASRRVPVAVLPATFPAAFLYFPLSKSATTESASTLLHCLSCHFEMILPDFAITKLCLEGMVEPFDKSLVNPASIDVRLGNKIMVEDEWKPEMVPINLNEFEVDEDTPFMLSPGQFILAETIETFNLPDTIAAQFVLKSSRAREGIQHLLAGYCDPGWFGSKLTMELKNIRELHEVAIWPGMKIGQMVFQRMECAPFSSYAVTGRYNQDQEVTASKG